MDYTLNPERSNLEEAIYLLSLTSKDLKDLKAINYKFNLRIHRIDIEDEKKKLMEYNRKIDEEYYRKLEEEEKPDSPMSIQDIFDPRESSNGAASSIIEAEDNFVQKFKID